MIEQTEEMNALLDAYENLLTDKQKEIMSLYFKEDFHFLKSVKHYIYPEQQ